MTSLYEVLKRSKTAPQLAPDMFTALWAKSITAGKTIELSGQVPLSFKANGKPLLDFLISGNTVQSGTPTPDNPVDVNGVGVRTENLFDYKTAYASYLSGDDVVITPIQMTSEKQYFKASEVGKTITISVFAKTVTSNRVFIRASIGGTNINSNTVSRGNSGTLTVTVTPTSTSDFFNLTYGDGGDYNTFNKIMVNEGSTALPYEPYGIKIPISSVSTTTPVYLGEVETTRKIKKYEFKGTEHAALYSLKTQKAINIQIPDSNIPADPTANALIVGISDRYTPYTRNALWGRDADGFSYSNSANTIVLSDSRYQTVDSFKTYLADQYAAGTPVTVWYVLANETTGIVNEPLMRIGDYADTLSMEQAGVQIPTNKGSTTLDVLTAVKPSNVSIKYRV